MKTLTLIFVLFITTNLFMYASGIVPDKSPRVDTTNADVKQVYDLFVNYLNSEPDKGYKNPCWNEADYQINLNRDNSKLDRSAYFLFMGMNSKQFYSIFKPYILLIDSIAPNRYIIKTLFEATDPKREVIGITKHYAVRNTEGEYKLENAMTYDTKDWNIFKSDFITYIVDPSIAFDSKEAEKSVKFCKEVANKLGLEIKPFKYYACANKNQLAGLYNFDYWIFGIKGLANSVVREVFSSYCNFYFPHEFIHLILPRRTDGHAPNIINEGIATWLGGPLPNKTYQEALAEVKVSIKNFENITIDRIIAQEIRNPADSNILYVTGALICETAYNLKGKDALMKLYFSNNKDLKKDLEEVFEMSFEEIEKMILSRLGVKQ